MSFAISVASEPALPRTAVDTGRRNACSNTAMDAADDMATPARRPAKKVCGSTDGTIRHARLNRLAYK